MKKGRLMTGAVLLLLAAVAAAVLLTTARRTPASLGERAEKAFKYVNRKGLNGNYCLLLDYGIESGKPRLFVWSFSEKRVIYAAHAMHGPGRGSTDATPVFSNVPGSNCSSVGRFEVTRDRGRRNRSGLRLRGLDRSNSKAYARGIMIHGSRWVDLNRWRSRIPLNGRSCRGCVTVSTRDMAYINRLVGKEDKNLLLWSFCDASSRRESEGLSRAVTRVHKIKGFSKCAFQGPGRPTETFLGNRGIYMHTVQSPHLFNYPIQPSRIMTSGPPAFILPVPAAHPTGLHPSTLTPNTVS